MEAAMHRRLQRVEEGVQHRDVAAEHAQHLLVPGKQGRTRVCDARRVDVGRVVECKRRDYLTKADENKHVYGFKKLVIMRSKLIPLLFLLVLG